MKKRLLFVDDDRLVLATLSKGLRNAGYLVETAESGIAALGLAAAASFDLAIIDICMPEMSGIELANSLRDNYDLSSLFLSAYSDQQMVEEAAHVVGSIGYVVKPVDLPQLLPALETALARSQDLRSLLAHKEQLERALNGDRRISAGVGILMERHQLNQQAAFELLRKMARNKRRSLADIAVELISTTDRLATLN